MMTTNEAFEGELALARGLTLGGEGVFAGDPVLGGEGVFAGERVIAGDPVLGGEGVFPEVEAFVVDISVYRFLHRA